MLLILNGDKKDIPDGATVASFLAELGVPEKGVAVERNLEIIPKSAYASTYLQEGDQLEVIQFVGGG